MDDESNMLTGCVGIVLVALVIVLVVGIAPLLWQFIFNTVLFGVFGLFRPVTYWEAAGIWLLVCVIGQMLRGIFSSGK